MTTGRLARTLFAGYLVMSAAALVLQAQVPAAALGRDGGSFWLTVSFVVVMTVFGLVGAIVASRMPQNPIGWIFLCLALIEGVFELAYGYTFFSLFVAGQPGTTYTAWLANWLGVVSPAPLGLAFLLFPTGRLLSRRWRPLAWLTVLAVVPVIAHFALVPGPLDDFPEVDNPFGPSWAGFLRDLPPDPSITVILAIASVAVVVRFRRSRGVERQQLKWFAWAVVSMIGLVLVANLVVPASSGADQTMETVGGFVFAVLFCGLPVSVGISILRYRLYDIDLVINRTLVYGSLTATLVGTYLASVLVLRLALQPLAGESDLAVAASTLAVAALFRPLRDRIQVGVDRRFYRSRYDTERTLQGFAGRLRGELDLDTLGIDLRRVVDDAMHPAHVSLWLRSSR